MSVQNGCEVPYMDKFVVSKLAQGIGTGKALWLEVLEDCVMQCGLFAAPLTTATFPGPCLNRVEIELRKGKAGWIEIGVIVLDLSLVYYLSFKKKFKFRKKKICFFVFFLFFSVFNTILHFFSQSVPSTPRCSNP